MRTAKIAADDLGALEPLLTRKASDLRRGVLGLILSLDDAGALASAERLVSSKNASQRLAGLDLLIQLKDANRGGEKVRTVAESLAISSRTTLERNEPGLSRQVDRSDADHLHARRRAGPDGQHQAYAADPAAERDVKFCTPATNELLKSLDEFIHEHREEAITVEKYEGKDGTDNYWRNWTLVSKRLWQPSGKAKAEAG